MSKKYLPLNKRRIYYIPRYTMMITSISFSRICICVVSKPRWQEEMHDFLFFVRTSLRDLRRNRRNCEYKLSIEYYHYSAIFQMGVILTYIRVCRYRGQQGLCFSERNGIWFIVKAARVCRNIEVTESGTRQVKCWLWRDWHNEIFYTYCFTFKRISDFN